MEGCLPLAERSDALHICVHVNASTKQQHQVAPDVCLLHWSEDAEHGQQAGSEARHVLQAGSQLSEMQHDPHIRGKVRHGLQAGEVPSK